MRRSRLRSWAKWGCTVAAALMVGLAGFNLFRSVIYCSRNGITGWLLFIEGGRIQVAVFDDAKAEKSVPKGWSIEGSPSWSWGMNDQIDGIKWRGGFAWTTSASPIRFSVAGVTILYPFLLTALPAGLLWYTDRRRFAAHACQKCGYDRRGLAADAKCP